MTRLDEIEARLNAITPGKWHSYDENSIWSEDVFVAEADHEGDVPFILAAPDDMRYLLDEVKRLKIVVIDAGHLITTTAGEDPDRVQSWKRRAGYID